MPVRKYSCTRCSYRICTQNLCMVKFIPAYNYLVLVYYVFRHHSFLTHSLSLSLWVSAFSLRRRLIFHFEQLSALLFAKRKPRKTVCMQCGYEANVKQNALNSFVCLFAWNGIVQNGIWHFKAVDGDKVK